MVIAPHPDDESLGCSILLQRAVATGAAIRVIYATNGEANPWPQRVLERKWRINSSDRARWGVLRQSEALAALKVLGLEAECAQFLGLPDQGLTNLLRKNCSAIVQQFVAMIIEWSPTHLLIPSTFDTHPDHNALAVILQLGLNEILDSSVSVSGYAIHGKSRAFCDRAAAIAPSHWETERKLHAIRCHRTQLMLSRKRFLSYAERPERLLRAKDKVTFPVDGGIRQVLRRQDMLRIRVELPPKLISTSKPALSVAGRDRNGVARCLKADLPGRTSAIVMLNCDQHFRAEGRYRGTPSSGEFTISIELFSSAQPLFVKLERRSLFFDEAGWIEVAPLVTRPERAVRMPANTSLAVR